MKRNLHNSYAGKKLVWSEFIIGINNWSVDFWINYMNKNNENIWIKENKNIMHIFSEGFSETLFLNLMYVHTHLIDYILM